MYGLKFVQPKGDLITARSAKPWGLNNFHEAKLPRPAHAPYLHPCRQSFRVLLTPLTYIHVGKASRPASQRIVVKINLKRAVLANIIKN